MPNTPYTHTTPSNSKASPAKFACRAALLAGTALSVGFMSAPAYAQTANDDVVVVTGTRQTIQDVIALKKQATTIVDGLSASEIGDLPALSIGEALENLTGATSHVENGGATEISIRGLGPFLSSTVFNGREATNGGGDRSVNFSQFPSELLSKVAIYKTQDASLIEGGVAGQIHLDTVRPLDYGKRRFQGQLKGNINPDQLDIADSESGDLGYRGTLSYVDQFEMPGGGDIGVSIGFQRSDISQPEQEIRSTSPQSSSNLACVVGATGQNRGYLASASNEDDCEDPAGSSGTLDYNTDIDPATGLAFDDGLQHAFVVSQRGYRQNDTRDERNALFGALQFQPNDRLDINIDGQYSKRTQNEDRYDFTFDNSRRNSTSVSIGGVDLTSEGSLIVNPSGAIQQVAYESDASAAGEQFRRTEEYKGLGLSIDYDVSDRLTAIADFSFSETNRKELQTSTRVQTPSRVDVIYSVASGIPQYTVENFDPNDLSLYDDNIRLRVDNDLDRTNTNMSGRLDFQYDFDDGAFSGIEFGGRWSQLEFLNLAGRRSTFSLSDGDASIYACATPFAESNFLSSLSDGPLFTNVDTSGNVISAGTGSTFGTFDNQCITSAILAGNGVTGSNLDDIGIEELIPLIEEGTGTTDVTEQTIAGYVMANYDTSFDGLPIRGNFGVRVVNTSVDSIGYRGALSVVTAADGSLSLVQDGSALEQVVGGGSYTEVLPSINFIMDVKDNVLFRAAAFRGLSRVDPSDMGFSRNIGVNTDTDITDVADLITSISGSGNPNAKPLTSWNFDAAVEWYPNADSIFALGTYYKSFKGGFETAVVSEDFQVDGQVIPVSLNLPQSSEDTSGLWGLEATVAHRFSYLPGALSGFGTKMGYNYAASSFEFDDSDYGLQGIRNADGTFTQTTVRLVDPGTVPGLSKHVFSGQLYYQIGKFDIAGIYKYRSRYFQPFTGDGTVLRYTGGRGIVEAKLSYKLNDDIRISVEALNILNQERRDAFRTIDNFGQASAYGPRIFFGVRGKF